MVGACARPRRRAAEPVSRPRRGVGWRRCWARRRGSGRSRRTTPPPSTARLRAARARPWASRASCWPRPAPASARRWATSRRPACGRRRTAAPVWVSTYTRNLQHQIDQELDRLYPDPAAKARRGGRPQGPRELSLPAELRGGRARASAPGRRDAMALGLMARWAARDARRRHGRRRLPGWLADLLGRRAHASGSPTGAANASTPPARITALLHRAHGAPRAPRRDRRRQPRAGDDPGGARPGADEGGADRRASCSTRAIICSTPPTPPSPRISPASETAELRRWILRRRRARPAAAGARPQAPASRTCRGDERGRRRRAGRDDHRRGAARCPATGWHQRCADGRAARPGGAFLAAVRTQVLARAHGRPARPLRHRGRHADAGARRCSRRRARSTARSHQLAQADRPRCAAAWLRRLDEEADDLDTATRVRIEAVCRSLQRRAEVESCGRGARCSASLAGRRPPEFVDWFARRAHRRPRRRRRHAPPLGRPDAALRRRRGGAGARRAGHLGDAARRHRRRRGRLGGGRGAHRRRATCRRGRSAPPSPRRSTMPARRASSS